MATEFVRRGLVEKWEDDEFTGSDVIGREDFVREVASHPEAARAPQRSPRAAAAFGGVAVGGP